MNWLQKITSRGGARTQGSAAAPAKGKVPDGVWEKCAGCQVMLYKPELERHLMVCPKCDHHHGIRARTRLLHLFDEGSSREWWPNMRPVDPLKFRDSKKYRDRLASAQKSSGEKEAMIAMSGTLDGHALMMLCFDFDFLGGSMGSVVGEKFARAAEKALADNSALVCISATGGARMQESLFSLFQMAKTSAVLSRLRAAGVPYISVLTHPTTGGVSASLALLGDINIAEPKALIGFAGPRVIEQTVREKLPEGFQRSEFLLEHGAIDMIVDRRQLRVKLATLLSLLKHSSVMT